MIPDYFLPHLAPTCRKRIHFRFLLLWGDLPDEIIALIASGISELTVEFIYLLTTSMLRKSGPFNKHQDCEERARQIGFILTISSFQVNSKGILSDGAFVIGGSRLDVINCELIEETQFTNCTKKHVEDGWTTK